MTEKILTWNINSATNRNIITPHFVGKEIQIQNSDFFILTEFCKTKNHQEFCKEYIEKDYNYIISNNPSKHNNILIAWRKNKYDLIKVENNFITHETIPNFAYVILKNKKGLEFVLSGIRITIEDYENRAKQLLFALDNLKDFQNVVLAGDFNCLRRETLETKWNIKVLSKQCINYGFKLITPNGQSIYTKKARDRAHEFAEDHFIVKGIDVLNPTYDRSFTTRNSNIYLFGENFCVYDYNFNKTLWSIEVGSGNPDHAILFGNMSFDY